MGRTAFGCGSLRGTGRRGTNRRLTPSTLPEACVTTASSTVSEPTGHFVQFDQFELIDSKCNECNPDYSPTANDHRAAVYRRTGRRFGPGPDGLLYIAMELLPGRDLFHVILEDWPISTERAADIMTQALAA